MSTEGIPFILSVWIERDATDDEGTPDVYGTMTLTNEQYAVLDSQLYGLMGEDFITEYKLAEVTVPDAIWFTDPLNAVLNAFPDNEDEIMSIWSRKA